MRKLIRKKIKEKEKFFRRFVFGIILLIVIFSIFTLYSQKRIISETNKENLQFLAEEKATKIDLFFEFQREKVLLLSSMDSFRDLIEDPNDLEKINAAKKQMLEIKEWVPGVTVIGEDHKTIMTEGEEIVVDYSSHPYFSSGNKEIFFDRYYDLREKKDYFGVISPIFDSKDKEKIIGHVFFTVELEKLNSLMKGVNSEDGMEVYVIDRDGVLLTESSYVGGEDKKGVLIQVVRSEEAIDCLNDLEEYYDGKEEEVEEHEEEMGKYPNYVGEEVYGVHSYVPVIGGCVLAEKNSKKIDNVSQLWEILGGKNEI